MQTWTFRFICPLLWELSASILTVIWMSIRDNCSPFSKLKWAPKKAPKRLFELLFILIGGLNLVSLLVLVAGWLQSRKNTRRGETVSVHPSTSQYILRVLNFTLTITLLNASIQNNIKIFNEWYSIIISNFCVFFFKISRRFLRV